MAQRKQFQAKLILMRPKKGHTSTNVDYIGKRTQVEFKATSLSHDGVEYEVDSNGTVEAPEDLVPLFESHGFERVPVKASAAA